MANDFSSDFALDFDIGSSSGFVELVLNLSVDDHPRPNHALWRRYGYPNSQVGLLLYMDGRVQVVTQFDLAAVMAADDYVAGGHRVIIEDDSWQAAVLAAAGYQLIPWDALAPQGIPGYAYGEGFYGDFYYGGTAS